MGREEAEERERDRAYIIIPRTHDLKSKNHQNRRCRDTLLTYISTILRIFPDRTQKIRRQPSYKMGQCGPIDRSSWNLL